MRRPQSLAEVGRIAAHAPDRFWTALDEFLDTFYFDHGDVEAQADRIAEAPPVLGDALLDAWTGAVGAHLAERWMLPLPGWTRRPAHFRLAAPQFVPATPALMSVLVRTSPPAFRARRIYTVSEPLQRARFPQEGPVAARRIARGRSLAIA